MAAAVAAAVQALRAAGATIREPAPPVDLSRSHRLFQRLVQPWTAMGLPDDRYAQLCARTDVGDDEHGRWVADLTSRTRSYLFAREEQAAVRARWAGFFRDHDALLCPITPGTAPAHDTGPDPRWISVDGRLRPYTDQVIWCQAFSVAGLPAAAVPVGLADGLPVGLQVVGPYLGDRTVVDLAVRISAVLGGATPPPARSVDGNRTDRSRAQYR